MTSGPEVLPSPLPKDAITSEDLRMALAEVGNLEGEIREVWLTMVASHQTMLDLPTVVARLLTPIESAQYHQPLSLWWEAQQKLIAAPRLSRDAKLWRWGQIIGMLSHLEKTVSSLSQTLAGADQIVVQAMAALQAQVVSMIAEADRALRAFSAGR